MFDLLPELEELCNRNPEEGQPQEMVDMAIDLITKITTRDSRWFGDQDGHPRDSNDNNNEKEKSTDYKDEALSQILKDLADPLVPVRAYGLVCLRKYVLRDRNSRPSNIRENNNNNNNNTSSRSSNINTSSSSALTPHLDKILSLFHTQLQDSDS